MKTKLLAAVIVLSAACSLLFIKQEAQRKEEPQAPCPPFCFATCAKLDRAWLDRGHKM